MQSIPRPLLDALAAQHAHWQAALESGARRVGWKLGVGERERIEGRWAIGYLTSETQLQPGTTYEGHARQLNADAEIALLLGADLDADTDTSSALEAIAGCAPALELVDLAGTDDPARIIENNLWHRAFALGPTVDGLPRADLEGALLVDGNERARGRIATDLGERVRVVAEMLGAVGEHARAGDWIITGSVVQVPVGTGERVLADFGTLGQVAVRVSPQSQTHALR